MNILKNISTKILLSAAIAVIIGFGGSYAFISAQTNDIQASGVAVEVDLNKSLTEPETIAIKTGQTVMFNSIDGRTHNMSLGEGGDDHNHYGPFSSGDFGTGEAWKVSFSEPGTFFFHDHYNPDINILVVVYDNSEQ